MCGMNGSSHSSRSSSRSSSINNNCSETVDHHFSEESKKMNGGGSSEKSEDGGGSTGSPPSPAGRGGSGSGSPSPCPSCRQLLCSCGKSSSAASLLNYQRLASTVPSLVYAPNPSNPNASSAYSPDQVAYLAAVAAASAEHSALYAAAGGGMPDMKEGGLGPSGWAYPSMYHPYDPSFAAAAAAAAAAYPFNGYSMDMNGSRRKNATRETTSTLKAWLAEHRKNPYPTKGEKIMLAIITKMTLTQVSTWFANARRRLKKENKMTWEPRNRPDDDDDDVNISDSEQDERKDDKDNERLSSSTNSHHVHGKSSPTESSCSDVSKEGASVMTPNQKPRIWSVADLAGSDSRDDGDRREGPPHSSHSIHPHHLIPHPHLLNLHNHHSSGGSSGSSSGSSGGHPSAASAAAAAAAAAFLHNSHLRNSSHHQHLQQLHHQHLAHAGSNHHHPGASSLPGSAFSPLSSRSTAHSEAIYRGLYPLPHPAAYHSSSTADNP